jgi:hypothetical protein
LVNLPSRLPGPDREGSTAARFSPRVPESVPPIRRIKNREVDHLRKFAAMRRAMPGRDDADLIGACILRWRSHHTIREKERLTKLSRTMRPQRRQAIVDRVVSVSVMALTGGETPAKKAPARPSAAWKADAAGFVS